MAGRMTIDDHREAGRLLIDLATGRVPVPRTQKKRLELLRQYGIALAGYRRVHLHRNTADELHIVIPRRDLIEQTERDLVRNPTRAYLFPPGVEPAYRQALLDPPTSPEEKASLFEHRIGDYSLGQCL